MLGTEWKQIEACADLAEAEAVLELLQRIGILARIEPRPTRNSRWVEAFCRRSDQPVQADRVGSGATPHERCRIEASGVRRTAKRGNGASVRTARGRKEKTSLDNDAAIHF